MTRPLLFVPGKLRYVRGDRPKVDCILCATLSRDKKVTNLIVAEDRLVYVTLNLFPYNPGHLMIVPRRHITDLRASTAAERRSIDAWTLRLLDVLDRLYQPSGYNLGYNLGMFSGASIPHLHLHVVPRFKNEAGFIDIISGARIHVDDPSVAVRRLKRALAVAASGKRPVPTERSSRARRP